MYSNVKLRLRNLWEGYQRQWETSTHIKVKTTFYTFCIALLWILDPYLEEANERSMLFIGFLLLKYLLINYALCITSDIRWRYSHFIISSLPDFTFQICLRIHFWPGRTFKIFGESFHVWKRPLKLMIKLRFLQNVLPELWTDPESESPSRRRVWEPAAWTWSTTRWLRWSKTFGGGWSWAPAAAAPLRWCWPTHLNKTTR